MLDVLWPHEGTLVLASKRFTSAGRRSGIERIQVLGWNGLVTTARVGVGFGLFLTGWAWLGTVQHTTKRPGRCMLLLGNPACICDQLFAAMIQHSVHSGYKGLDPKRYNCPTPYSTWKLAVGRLGLIPLRQGAESGKQSTPT